VWAHAAEAHGIKEDKRRCLWVGCGGHEQLTGLLQPMPAIDLLALIDQIFSDERLAAASETDRRSFDRTRAAITAIAARPASVGWFTTLYVRGSEPPRQAFVLHPPRLLVVALKAGRLYFVMAVGPRGKTAHDSKEAEALELELLSRTRPRRTASRRTSAAASGWGAVGTLPNPLNTERTKACTRAPSQTETAAALRRLSFVAAERSHHCLLATGNWQVLWKLGTGSSRLTQWNEAQT
jgi:hypothetical protein